MSTAGTLEVINASLGIIRLLRMMQVDVERLNTLQAKAEQEGRELNDIELQSLADSAQAAIDKLNG